jgi:hypothetical protein
MASIVSAGTTSATALNMSADTTGILQLASNNGTVGLTMDTSQNVGIGTTSPAQKLHVYGSGAIFGQIESSTATSMGLVLKNTARQYNMSVGSGGNWSIYDATASADRIVMDTSGNVGIGVTPQTWSSSFKPALQFGTMGSLLNGSGYTFLSNNWYQDASGTDKYITTNFATNYYQYNGTHVWRTAPSGTAGNAITFTQAMTLDASGNLQFNSGYGSVATAYGCRAWVNFNGTGTVAIRASGNVSSITDNGVGDYTVNFTTAMPDANYSAIMTISRPTISADATRIVNIAGNNPPTTTTVRLFTDYAGNTGGNDTPYICVSIFR